MSANGGNIQPSTMWTDVFLDVAEDQCGPVLSISLSEPSRSNLIWECKVNAITKYGSFHCGSLRTRPPIRGGTASRLVGTAFYPGAVGWSTSWRVVAGSPQPNSGDPAKVTLACGDGATAFPGVTPAASGPSTLSLRSFSTFPAVGGAPAPILPQGSLLFSVVGNLNDAAAPAAFAMLFDQTAAPIAGDVPFWSHSCGVVFIADTSDFSYPVTRLDAGRHVDFRLWLALSSTSPAFTPIVGQTAIATVEAALP